MVIYMLLFLSLFLQNLFTHESITRLYHSKKPLSMCIYCWTLFIESLIVILYIQKIDNHPCPMTSSQHLKKDLQYFATTAVSLFTLLSTFRTFKYQLKLYLTRKEIKQIQSSEILEVQDIAKRGLKVNELVLIHGNIGTKDGQQVTIQLSKGNWVSKAKEQKFAIHLAYKEPIYSNQSFDSNKTNYVFNMKEALKKSYQLKGSSKITLTSEGKGMKTKGQIFIRNFDQKDYSKVLDVVKWEQDKRRLSLGEDLNIFFLSLLQGIVSLGATDKNVPYVRGLEIGRRDIEVGIKIGASISILGTVGITTDGQFFIQAKNIFRDRLTELSSLNDLVDQHIGKRNFWLLCSLIGGAYVGRRIFLAMKDKKWKFWGDDVQATK